VPRVGTPAPEVHAGRRWGTQTDRDRESGVVPRRKQLGKQPDEAMPSSRGDARTAERARTGGVKTAPRRDQRISEQEDQCVLLQVLGDRLLDAKGSDGETVTTTARSQWLLLLKAASHFYILARGPLNARSRSGLLPSAAAATVSGPFLHFLPCYHGKK
jgi:hypothetical protein